MIQPFGMTVKMEEMPCIPQKTWQSPIPKGCTQDDNIKGVTTVPSLVQHIGDESLVGIKRHRVALDFTIDPPLEGW